MLLPHDYHLTIHKAPKSQWQHRIRLFPVNRFLLLVNLPALYKCRYASEQSSVCIPRSLRSVSAISSPRALGILPIPSCRVAPSHMYGRRFCAIFRSISDGTYGLPVVKVHAFPLRYNPPPTHEYILHIRRVSLAYAR